MTAISDSARLEKERRNKVVEQNRQYLQRLINAIFYLCKQELPLRGHDEKDTSLNKGNYRELLNCFADIDSVFASRLNAREGSSKFSGLSSTIQNNIIQAIDVVIGNEIKNEVENALFISIQVDETTDCAMQSQFSIILRYVNKCHTCKRFLVFFK